MAVTEFQRTVLNLIAENRKRLGVSYVAGGVALNQLIKNPRISRDIDIFHDTEEAVHSAWTIDKHQLTKHGYDVNEVRILPSFIEALVKKEQNTVLMQWTRDSAFRFFPLQEDSLFGLTLHPFDLATNKVLALAGRLEVRDWIDVMQCHDNLQNLGYLFWAACGKDAGFNPKSLLAEAKRSSHYSVEEINRLSFEAPIPEPHKLGEHWRSILEEAGHIITFLPPEQAGTCVIDIKGNLFTGNPEHLEEALQAGRLRFHQGSIRGAYPKLHTPEGLSE